MTDQGDVKSQENDPDGHSVGAQILSARRRLLKTLAGAGGVVAAGALLPEKWSRPVVDRVLMPAHAQATGNTQGASCIQGSNNNYLIVGQPNTVNGVQVHASADLRCSQNPLFLAAYVVNDSFDGAFEACVVLTGADVGNLILEPLRDGEYVCWDGG